MSIHPVAIRYTCERERGANLIEGGYGHGGNHDELLNPGNLNL